MLIPIIIGCVGFLLYLLYDVNSITGKSPLLAAGFFAGTLLIAVSTVWMTVSAVLQGAFGGAWDVLLIGAAALSLAALIYCLFFALPFKDTYADPLTEKKTCDTGAYALCRHPGVIFFFLTYLFLGLAALPSRLLTGGMIFSVLNLLYVVLQDLVTFPRTFPDYGDYRKRVPFLIPTIHSIRRAAETLGRNRRKEDGK